MALQLPRLLGSSGVEGGSSPVASCGTGSMQVFSEAIVEPLNLVQYPDHEEAMQISQSLLTATLADLRYTTLPYLVPQDFESPVHRTRSKDRKTLQRSNPDALVAEKYDAGNCVAFAMKIFKALRKSFPDSVAILPASLPPRFRQQGYPEIAHASAVLLTCKGWLIFEPTFFISEPIVLPHDGEVSVHTEFKETWTFIIGAESIVVQSDGSEQFTYKLGHIANPFEAITVPTTSFSMRIPVVRMAENGKKLAHLSIRIDTHMLEGFNGEDGRWYDRFPWPEDIESIPTSELVVRLAVWPGLSDDQCERLGYEPTLLREQVAMVLKAECIEHRYSESLSRLREISQ